LIKVLLFVQLLYVVNQVHFSWVPGLGPIAPTNLLFILTLLAMRGKPDVIDTPGILRKPLLVFFAALTFAFLWAQVRAPGNFVDDATYLKNAIFFPLYYFLFLKSRQDEKTTRRLIIWILIIAAVAGLEALHEGMDYGFGNYNPSRRASGPFGTDWHMANRAGVFYGMFMPMFVALVLFLRKRVLWRLAAFGACVVIAGGAFSTYSRQSYFLVLLGTVLLLIRRNIITAVIVGITLVSLAGYLPDSVVQRVDETKQTGKHGEETVDESTSGRWELWAGAMSMFASNPLGVGLNRFKTEIGNYSPHKGFDAHSFYVLTLAECGPFGIVALLILIAMAFRLAKFLRMNVPNGDPELTALTLGFTFCTLNMALGGIYGSPTLEGSVMTPYWALAGTLERYIHLKASNAGMKPQAPAQPSLAERFSLAAHIFPGR
jgi:O-antigen ligase